ncbi:alpha/beta hydrolase [Kitasatospora sp. NPDC004240]
MTTARPITPESVPYGDGGWLLDVYRPVVDGGGTVPVVLLWHGRGPGERDVMRPLAQEAAGLGLLVLAPDWHSTAPDQGAAQLLASLDHARREAAAYGGDPERMVLAGWSMSGREAVALATRPTPPAGWRPLAAVGISSRYDTPSVTTGTPPLESLSAGPSPVPVHLVHGLRDDLVDPARSRELYEVMTRQGSAVHLTEPDTDHAGAVLTEYDPAVDRCVPARAAHAVEAGRTTARVLATAAGLHPAAGAASGSA